MTTPTTDRLDPTTLRALAKRVEAGERGGEIDTEVWLAILHPSVRFEAAPSGLGTFFSREMTYARTEATVHPLTKSLDAVEALRMRLLPEFPPTIIPVSQGRGYNVRQRYRRDRLVAFVDVDIDCTETAARLAALLYALAAKVEGEMADA